MACYVIGDVQGCIHELQLLLQLIRYDDSKDQLIFVGDLVNRGPHSLDTLQLIRSLNNVRVTLGNHDLYLLALGYQAVAYDGEHTLGPLLQSPDLHDHLEWLRQQSILLIDDDLDLVAMHAGIPPQWDLSQAKQHAQELENILRGPHYLDYLQHMVGHTPAAWSDDLSGWDRLRYITNAFTRLRFCDANGTLELKVKSAKTIDIPDYKPWFNWPHDFANYRLAFGHWASLEGQCDANNIYAIDTGCVWGNKLTAMKIDNDKSMSLLSVPASPSQ
ncbi:MAG: symmetrical bis(5'-nucleosyl)-tetraphosphatase [Coxiellaceae bacterium]|nr:symmetrical bis(5'-nucleosyl)-tetraphosphatase [Coxiellaceae bacterium]